MRIKSLTDQAAAAYADLASLVMSLDLLHLKSVADKANNKKISKHQKIQEKKLLRLHADSPSTSINPDDVIFNFSDRILTADEKSILSRGLNFALPKTKLDYCDFLVPFEILQRKLYHETDSAASNMLAMIIMSIVTIQSNSFALG